MASIPNFASDQAGTITSVDTITAPAAIAHQPRGHTNSAAAATRKRHAAASHKLPKKAKLAAAVGTSATPNARANPSR